jgi:hypothetical protein
MLNAQSRMPNAQSMLKAQCGMLNSRENRTLNAVMKWNAQLSCNYRQRNCALELECWALIEH